MWLDKPRNPNAPLAGLKVLELARVLAGPWAGQMLADGFDGSGMVLAAMWDNGFRQITNDGIAFLEEPKRDARLFGGPFAQQTGVHRAGGPPMGKDGDCPDFIGIAGRTEVIGQSGNFRIGFCIRIECSDKIRKCFHGT